MTTSCPALVADVLNRKRESCGENRTTVEAIGENVLHFSSEVSQLTDTSKDKFSAFSLKTKF
jgi:hypothetical protein